MTTTSAKQPMPELVPLLKRLRLSGILESLPERNREALDAKLSHTEFLALLIQDEGARREQKKFALRVRRAGFGAQKTLVEFDFIFNTRVDQVLDPGSGHLPFRRGESGRPHRRTLRNREKPHRPGPGAPSGAPRPRRPLHDTEPASWDSCKPPEPPEPTSERASLPDPWRA